MRSALPLVFLILTRAAKLSCAGVFEEVAGGDRTTTESAASAKRGSSPTVREGFGMLTDFPMPCMM